MSRAPRERGCPARKSFRITGRFHPTRRFVDFFEAVKSGLVPHGTLKVRYRASRCRFGPPGLGCALGVRCEGPAPLLKAIERALQPVALWCEGPVSTRLSLTAESRISVNVHKDCLCNCDPSIPASMGNEINEPNETDATDRVNRQIRPSIVSRIIKVADEEG